MVDKMNSILENLAYAIGADSLKKFSEATTAPMTAPFARPLGVGISRANSPNELQVDDEDAADEEIDVLAPGGTKEDPQGGDPSYYEKETTKSSYPHGVKPSKTADVKEDKQTPASPEAKGKAVAGEPGNDDPDGADTVYYQKEKKLRELDNIVEKPQGKGTSFEKKEREIPAKKLSEINDIVTLNRLAEDDVPAEPKKADPKKPEEPAKPEWEIYVTSGDMDAVVDKAVAAVKEVAAAQAMLCVKFKADEAGRDKAIEGLKASGFDVIGVELEK